MGGIEHDISSRVEEGKSELDKLFDYERRVAVQRAIAAREGARWASYSMEQRSTLLYAMLAKLRAEAEKMFGRQELLSAYTDKRNMMLDAVILNELGSAAAAQPLKSAEQGPAVPVSKQDWLKRYAGMLNPKEADAGYDTYVKKVREGRIKP